MNGKTGILIAALAGAGSAMGAYMIANGGNVAFHATASSSHQTVTVSFDGTNVTLQDEVTNMDGDKVLQFNDGVTNYVYVSKDGENYALAECNDLTQHDFGVRYMMKDNMMRVAYLGQVYTIELDENSQPIKMSGSELVSGAIAESKITDFGFGTSNNWKLGPADCSTASSVARALKQDDNGPGDPNSGNGAPSCGSNWNSTGIGGEAWWDNCTSDMNSGMDGCQLFLPDDNGVMSRPNFVNQCWMMFRWELATLSSCNGPKPLHTNPDFFTSYRRFTTMYTPVSFPCGTGMGSQGQITGHYDTNDFYSVNGGLFATSTVQTINQGRYYNGCTGIFGTKLNESKQRWKGTHWSWLVLCAGTRTHRAAWPATNGSTYSQTRCADMVNPDCNIAPRGGVHTCKLFIHMSRMNGFDSCRGHVFSLLNGLPAGPTRPFNEYDYYVQRQDGVDPVTAAYHAYNGHDAIIAERIRIGNTVCAPCATNENGIRLDISAQGCNLCERRKWLARQYGSALTGVSAHWGWTIGGFATTLFCRGSMHSDDRTMAAKTQYADSSITKDYVMYEPFLRFSVLAHGRNWGANSFWPMFLKNIPFIGLVASWMNSLWDEYYVGQIGITVVTKYASRFFDLQRGADTISPLPVANDFHHGGSNGPLNGVTGAIHSGIESQYKTYVNFWGGNSIHILGHGPGGAGYAQLSYVSQTQAGVRTKLTTFSKPRVGRGYGSTVMKSVYGNAFSHANGGALTTYVDNKIQGVRTFADSTLCIGDNHHTNLGGQSARGCFLSNEKYGANTTAFVYEFEATSTWQSLKNKLTPATGSNVFVNRFMQGKKLLETVPKVYQGIQDMAEWMGHTVEWPKWPKWGGRFWIIMKNLGKILGWVVTIVSFVACTQPWNWHGQVYHERIGQYMCSNRNNDFADQRLIQFTHQVNIGTECLYARVAGVPPRQGKCHSKALNSTCSHFLTSWSHLKIHRTGTGNQDNRGNGCTSKHWCCVTASQHWPAASSNNGGGGGGTGKPGGGRPSL